MKYFFIKLRNRNDTICYTNDKIMSTKKRSPMNWEHWTST